MPLNIDVQQIFLHLFNFAILMGGLYFLLYSPVKKFMDNREKQYEDMDRQAREKNEKADELIKEYEAKLLKADEDIAAKKAEAEKKLKASIDEKIQVSKEEADRIIREAHDQAVSEHDKMIKNAREEMVDLAVEMTEKVMLSSEDPYEHFLDVAEKHLLEKEE